MKFIKNLTFIICGLAIFGSILCYSKNGISFNKTQAASYVDGEYQPELTNITSSGYQAHAVSPSYTRFGIDSGIDIYSSACTDLLISKYNFVLRSSLFIDHSIEDTYVNLGFSADYYDNHDPSYIPSPDQNGKRKAGMFIMFRSSYSASTPYTANIGQSGFRFSSTSFVQFNSLNPGVDGIYCVKQLGPNNFTVDNNLSTMFYIDGIVSQGPYDSIDSKPFFITFSENSTHFILSFILIPSDGSAYGTLRNVYYINKSLINIHAGREFSIFGTEYNITHTGVVLHRANATSEGEEFVHSFGYHQVGMLNKTRSFELNGGTATGLTPDNVKLGYYMDNIPAANLPTKHGYVFQGFYMHDPYAQVDPVPLEQNEQVFNSSGICNRPYSLLDSTTFYAYWTLGSYIVSVTTGTGAYNSYISTSPGVYSGDAPGTVAYPYGSTVYVHTHMINGFNAGGKGYTRVDENEDIFYKAITIDEVNNVTMDFNPNTYNLILTTDTITVFDTIEWTVSSSEQTITFDSCPTLAGYTHTGWTVGIDMEDETALPDVYPRSSPIDTSKITTTSVTFAPNSFPNKNYDYIRLDATWAPNTYTVSGICNPGATVSWSATQYGTYTSSVTVTYNSEIWYKIDAPVGYTAPKPSSGSLLLTTENFTLNGSNATKTFANCTPNTYDLTLNKMGGTGGTDSITATYDSYLPNVAIPTRTGYSFDGYFDDSIKGVGNLFINSSGEGVKLWQYPYGGGLYAQWTAITYNVAYNANTPSQASTSVTGMPSDAVWTYDENGTLGSSPSLTGWTFGGWYSDIGCTQYVGAGGETLTKPNLRSTSGTVNLYAKWTAYRSNVSFNYDGGTAPSSQITYIDYDHVTEVFAPSKPGYYFIGWKVTSGLGNVNAKWGTTSTPTETITSSDTLCGINAFSRVGSIFFFNLNLDQSAITLTAQWKCAKDSDDIGTFIDNFHEGCDCKADGSTDQKKLTSYWNSDASVEFGQLDEEEIYWFSRNVFSSTDAIFACTRKYDYIVTKYGLTDFMSRFSSTSSSSLKVNEDTATNNNVGIIIVSASSSLLLIGSALVTLFYRRKHIKN